MVSTKSWLTTAIAAVALLIVSGGGIYGGKLYLAGVRSYTDWLNYRMVAQVNSPVVEALLDGTIARGSPRRQVRTIEEPVWTKTLGRYAVYGYASGGYESRTLVFVDDRLVSASAGSCTWHWTFFDHGPNPVIEAAGTYAALQDAVQVAPQVAPYLQKKFDECAAVLGIPPVDLRQVAGP